MDVLMGAYFWLGFYIGLGTCALAGVVAGAAYFVSGWVRNQIEAVRYLRELERMRLENQSRLVTGGSGNIPRAERVK